MKILFIFMALSEMLYTNNSLLKINPRSVADLPLVFSDNTSERGFNFMEHYKNLSLSNLAVNINGLVYVEEWRDIKGYEGIYSVSSFGRVRSYSRMVWQPQMKRFAKRKERILKQKERKDEYLSVVLQVNNLRCEKTVHVLVANTFIPNPENKPQVNHKWGNKKHNAPYQLEWATAKENSNHAISIGIDSVVGTHNGRAKLSEQQVLEIRSTYKTLRNGEKREFAKKYPVTHGIVRRVAYSNSWKHI